MYKAFIEPDLQTAHIKIINKFNPFSGFQNPTYILKVNFLLLGTRRRKSGTLVCLTFWCLGFSFCFSQQDQFLWIKLRLSSPKIIQKIQRKLMIFIFSHLVKILMHANRIWGWGTGMASTISCLRFDWCFKLPCYLPSLSKAW